MDKRIRDAQAAIHRGIDPFGCTLERINTKKHNGKHPKYRITNPRTGASRVLTTSWSPSDPHALKQIEREARKRAQEIE